MHVLLKRPIPGIGALAARPRRLELQGVLNDQLGCVHGNTGVFRGARMEALILLMNHRLQRQTAVHGFCSSLGAGAQGRATDQEAP